MFTLNPSNIMLSKSANSLRFCPLFTASNLNRGHSDALRRSFCIWLLRLRHSLSKLSSVHSLTLILYSLTSFKIF